MNFLLIRSVSLLKFEAIFFARCNSVLVMFLLYLFEILESQEIESFAKFLYIFV